MQHLCWRNQVTCVNTILILYNSKATVIKMLLKCIKFYTGHDWWKYLEDVINFHVQWSLLACVKKGAPEKADSPYTVKVFDYHGFREGRNQNIFI